MVYLCTRVVCLDICLSCTCPCTCLFSVQKNLCNALHFCAVKTMHCIVHIIIFLNENPSDVLLFGLGGPWHLTLGIACLLSKLRCAIWLILSVQKLITPYEFLVSIGSVPCWLQHLQHSAKMAIFHCFQFPLQLIWIISKDQIISIQLLSIQRSYSNHSRSSLKGARAEDWNYTSYF